MSKKENTKPAIVVKHDATVPMERTFVTPNPNGEKSKLFLREQSALFTLDGTGVSGEVSNIIGGGVAVDFIRGNEREQWVFRLADICEAAQSASAACGGIISRINTKGPHP